jgi:flagellar hook-associated protein 1 FlgK
MMPSALLNIGRTGAAAARAGIELTAQNIANADNQDYARRTLARSEIVLSATIDLNPVESLGGVRVSAINRSGDEFLQIEARDSNSDLASAQAEISGLRGAETALEQSQVYETLVGLEAALTRLESDPLDPTLRTLALETARQASDTFGIADRALGTARGLVQTEITVGVEQINNLATRLAAINADLVGTRDGSARQAELFDARDAALRGLSDELGITVVLDDFGAAEVRLAGSPSELLVQQATASTLTTAFAADGTATLAVNGQAVTPASGAMAGRQAALEAQAAAQTELDAVALSLVSGANAAQTGGVDINGNAGQPLFSGSSAGTITLALSDPDQIATAPAGSPAGSRNTGALGNLIAAIGADTGPVTGFDGLLNGVSSRIAGLETRREGLAIVADSARAQLLAQTGVDLDTEAANLVRLQQAFEASSRVMQVATELFDTILALR